MGSPAKAVDWGEKDTVVEKLLAIFPAMDREVARSVLITCDYDLATTVDTLKELGIHKTKESTCKEESPTGRRHASGSISIPTSPMRGSSQSHQGSSPSSFGASPAGATASAVRPHLHGRSPSTYTFGSSPASNAYFENYQDTGVVGPPRGQSPINPYLTGGVSRPSTASPNPYLAPTNPYLASPGAYAPSGAFSGMYPASPSSRPSFYAYSYSSSPGSVYPIHAQSPSISAPSFGPQGGSGRPASLTMPGPGSNPYVFSSSPKIPHSQFPPAAMLGASSPNPFYTYSYSSSPGSVYPISAQPAPARLNPFVASSPMGSPLPSPHLASASPRTAYFSSLASTSPAASRLGVASSPSGGGMVFKKELTSSASSSSLDEHLLDKAIKIEDESEDEDSDEEDSDFEQDELDNELRQEKHIMFADEEGFDDEFKPPVSSPSQQHKNKKEKEKKPTIIIFRPRQPTSPAHSPNADKHQMPSLAVRKFMRLVFKNRTDISPMNPLAALFLCMSQVPSLRDHVLSDAYKSFLKPEKNKPLSAPSPSDSLADAEDAAEGRMSELSISGVWEAQGIYHGRRRSLAHHFAQCVKALQGTTHSDLRELDEQFAAFQQIVTGRTPHLSGTGSVEEEAGRYSEMADWVIEHLKEDFGVQSPAYEPTPEDELQGDDHVASQYWESYKRLNPALLANLFTCLLKTAIVCTGCGHRAVSVSVANGLVLPTSLDKMRSIVVTFVPESIGASRRPIKHAVSVFRTSYGLDIKQALIERLESSSGGSSCPVSLRPDQIVLAEVYGGRIAQLIDDGTPVSVLKEKDVVVAYEVPAAQQASVLMKRRMSFPLDKSSGSCPVPVPGQTNIPFFVINRYHKKHKGDEMGTHIVGKPFAVPRNVTCAQLYDMVFDRFKETLGYQKEQTYAGLMGQLRESEEKRLAGEKEGKGREDPKAPLAEATKGPFHIKIVDQFFANCGSCDKGFRCDGCVIPYEEDTPLEVAPDCHVVVDWNVPKEDFAARLSKSLALNLSPDKLEDCGATAPNVTLHDCFNKFLGQYSIPEWFCQNCKDFKQATKATTIGELPPSLMIHLSRFELNKYWHRLCKTAVDFPTKGLDLSGYVEGSSDSEQQQEGEARKPILYDLQAILQLSCNRGYSACIRNPGDQRFYHYTPTATYLLPNEDTDLASLKSILCSGDACILFYSRHES